MTPTKSQLHILRHSLGLDDSGRGTEFRNHFCTGPGTTDWPDIEALIALGLMENKGEVSMWGNNYGIVVTEAGKAVARKQDPQPKLSRGTLRYRKWLRDSDALNCSFGEWLKGGYAKEAR